MAAIMTKQDLSALMLSISTGKTIDSKQSATYLRVFDSQSKKDEKQDDKVLARVRKHMSLKMRTCKHIGCDKQSQFGFKGEGVQFCRKHKREGMINMKNKECEYSGCEKIAVYGHEESRCQFCRDHKQEGMVNKRSDKCQHIKCNKKSYFGFEGKWPQFCAQHKQEGMINLQSKRCEDICCDKQPSFGFEGRCVQFCSQHKQEGMINLKKRKRKFVSMQKSYANEETDSEDEEYLSVHLPNKFICPYLSVTVFLQRDTRV